MLVPDGLTAFGVSCSSPSTCLADSNDTTILATTDGGAQWSIENLPKRVSDVTSVNCIPHNACVVTGDDRKHRGSVSVTDDLGRSWTSVAISRTMTLASAASCSTSERCTAVGTYQPQPNSGAQYGAIAASMNGGTAWKMQSLPTAVNRFSDVSCADVDTCIAIGTLYSTLGAVALRTFDGGATWQPVILPSEVTSLSAVSCPTVDDCFLFGSSTNSYEFLSTTDDGHTWKEEAIPRASGLNSMDCPSASECVLVGFDVVRITDKCRSQLVSAEHPGQRLQLVERLVSEPDTVHRRRVHELSL